MKLLRALWTHVRYWGELYIAGPIVIGLLWLSIVWVNYFTHREVQDDVGAIVGWLLNAIGVVVVVMLAGLTQHFLYGYRSKTQPPALADDIFDACVTSFLLLLWSVIVFGLIR